MYITDISSVLRIHRTIQVVLLLDASIIWLKHHVGKSLGQRLALTGVRYEEAPFMHPIFKLFDKLTPAASFLGIIKKPKIYTYDKLQVIKP